MQARKDPRCFSTESDEAQEDPTRNCHMRCRACHTCRKCATEKHILQFEGSSPTCTMCAQMLTCTVCKKRVVREAFPGSQLKHKGNTERTRNLRCAACHTCKKCTTIKTIPAFKGASDTCSDCSGGFCTACNTHKPRHAFHARMFDNAQRKKTKLVCQECTANGMTPKAVRKYRCSECNEHRRLKFAKTDKRMYLASHGGISIACLDCYAKHNTIIKLLCD